jgi:cell division transport system ATP-binding protein
MEEQKSDQSSDVILLENVSVFQAHTLILANVNLRIDTGEFVYLIGETGSGKSSLLKLIYADLPMRDGFARVAGIDLHTIRRREIPLLRRKLGIVFQDFQLLTDRSVEDNLLFVMRATGWRNKQEMKLRAQEVLESVKLGGKGPKMPHQLSGGEQQRVGIARALLNKPEVILADEPTGNIDPATSEDVMEILLDISRSGTAVLTATHDYSLFRRFPARTFSIESGRLHEKRDPALPNEMDIASL